MERAATAVDVGRDVTLYAAEAANANPTAWIMHPRTWNTLSKIRTGIASDKTTLLDAVYAASEAPSAPRNQSQSS